MLSTIAAIAFTALAAVVVMFQSALVCGAPWGEMTMGGRYRGALPPRVRVAPALSAVLVIGFAVIVLARAGMAFADLHSLSTKLIWVVVAYCVVGSLVNGITPSKRERALWFPVVAAMLVCSLLVALQGR